MAKDEKSAPNSLGPLKTQEFDKIENTGTPFFTQLKNTKQILSLQLDMT